MTHILNGLHKIWLAFKQS